MTDISDTLPAPAPAPGWLGQGTAVEQSRAVAEVQGAIIVAQRVPRRLDVCRTYMRESCAQQSLAERAFYSFPKGKTNVTGPSVHLARELARCWGNVQYGIHELRRDEINGLSEMVAFAWDVQTNTRSANTFIVLHKRDKKDGPVALTDQRDIYENNANQASRRLREAIFAILPPWFKEEAIELCNAKLRKGDGSTIEDRRKAAIAIFDQMGVAVDRLEQKLGRPQTGWTVYDLAQLTITYRSLQRGEITIDEEFPRPRVTAAEITEQASTPGNGEAKADTSSAATAAPPPSTEPKKATAKQLTELNKLLDGKLGITGPDRFPFVADWLQEREISAIEDLSSDEADQLIKQLSEMSDPKAAKS